MNHYQDFFMLSVMIELVYRVGLIIMIAMIFTRNKYVKNFIVKDEFSNREKLSLGVFFGLLSILGTYAGIHVNGAIVNTRVIGVVVGGLLGGPVVGLISGVIAGGHRYLIDIGGFTAMSCAISTLVEGLIAGYMSRSFKRSGDKVSFALIVGLFVESTQMIILLMTATPYEDAVELVKIIGLPMIVVNSIGIALFVSIIMNIRNLSDIKASNRARESMILADKTLKCLRNELSIEKAKEAVKIIHEASDFDAVSITDNSVVLSHVGIGSDHHISGNPIATKLTHRVLNTKTFAVTNNRSDIGCKHSNCQLNAAVIVPLVDGVDVVGTVKFYRSNHVINEVDIEIAKGLGNLFSSQLELNRLEVMSELTLKAELQALQAQINPHFLFNALNTINSLIRTDPSQARELLMYLSDYFRKNCQQVKDYITIEEELKHLNAYLKIEKARFGNKLSVDINIHTRFDHLIPPFIIQPIVENSIKHGILKRLDGGKIVIDIEESEGSIAIRIEDNGVGMSEEHLASLLIADTNSIALKNINERIRSIYGKEGVFNIESKLEEGTIVNIRIPKLEVVPC